MTLRRLFDDKPLSEGEEAILWRLGYVIAFALVVLCFCVGFAMEMPQ